MGFLPFIWLYLWFYWISFSERFQTFSLYIKSGGIRILNTKKRRVCTVIFFRFLQIFVFYRSGKNRQRDFPEKRPATAVKHVLPVCQISLRHFTEGNARQVAVRLAFCAHIAVTKKHQRFPLSAHKLTSSARVRSYNVREPLSNNNNKWIPLRFSKEISCLFFSH